MAAMADATKPWCGPSSSTWLSVDCLVDGAAALTASSAASRSQKRKLRTTSGGERDGMKAHSALVALFVDAVVSLHTTAV